MSPGLFPGTMPQLSLIPKLRRIYIFLYKIFPVYVCIKKYIYEPKTQYKVFKLNDILK